MMLACAAIALNRRTAKHLALGARPAVGEIVGDTQRRSTAPQLVRHEHGHGRISKKISADAAEDEFLKTRMTKEPKHRKVGAGASDLITNNVRS